MTTRRRFLAGLGALLSTLKIAYAQSGGPLIRIHKDPSCGCCTTWAERLTSAGFKCEIIEEQAMNRLKARLGVPQKLASCHTAEIARYVIEGHVPPAEIVRLLAERPDARGLAVPGMPANSPGMEVPGALDEEYEVVLFGPAGERAFARYAGSRRL